MLSTFNATLHVPTFNLPFGATCPGRTVWCRQHCYAARGRFAWGLPALECRLAATKRPDFTAILTAEAQLWKARGAPAFRFHSSGDVYSPAYGAKILEVCRAVPDMAFFMYTRVWRRPRFRDWLAEADATPNLTVWRSTDPSTSARDLAALERSGVRVAYVLDPVRGPYSDAMPPVNCRKQTGESSAGCADCGLCYGPGAARRVTFHKHRAAGQ